VDEVTAVDLAIREKVWTGISGAERRQLSEILQRLEGNLTALLNERES
jgi:hypothetical protein